MLCRNLIWGFFWLSALCWMNTVCCHYWGNLAKNFTVLAGNNGKIVAHMVSPSSECWKLVHARSNFRVGSAASGHSMAQWSLMIFWVWGCFELCLLNCLPQLSYPRNYISLPQSSLLTRHQRSSLSPCRHVWFLFLPGIGPQLFPCLKQPLG